MKILLCQQGRFILVGDAAISVSFTDTSITSPNENAPLYSTVMESIGVLTELANFVNITIEKAVSPIDCLLEDGINPHGSW